MAIATCVACGSPHRWVARRGVMAGQRSQFTTGSPRENGFSFCPYCGGKLIEKSSPNSYATNLGRPDEPPEIVTEREGRDE